MYERYITLEDHDKYLQLSEDSSPDVEQCKEAIRTLLAQVDVMRAKAYDEDFGDNRLCKCGHTYYRHFDTYEGMSPVGCKYCYYEECEGFSDSGKVEVWKDQERTVVEYTGKVG
tara:strand:- start:70032 stop:70373 length:342 start_codon:yes stop_codon:yes gene_type:complete